MIGDKIADRLLSDRQFREAHKNNSFWQSHFDTTSMSRLFTWSELNHCLSFNRITNDRFRMSTCTEHSSLNRRAFRAVKDSLGRSTDYLVVSELHALMREGATAVLEAVNELSPTVCSLTERIAGVLGARSTANAYISFGSVSGFGMHHDDHDVIIMQLDGRKEWTFVKHEASGKATVADLAKPDEGRPGDSIVVSAGDVLYIPRGTWHNVTSINERSLHLTVSVVYPTIGEFLAWCMDQQKLGIPSTDIKSDHQCIDRAVESCRTFLSTLPCKENFESFLSAFYSGKRCSRTRANFPSLNTANQVDSFRRVPFEIITLQPSQPDRCEVFALGRVHSLTITEYAVLCGLPRTGAMSSAEIAKLGGGWASTAPVLESLLDRDLVTIVTNDA